MSLIFASKKTLWLFVALVLLTVQAGVGPLAGEAAASGITAYRVYQNDKALKEFVKREDALRYARQFSYSHVETIPDRTWIWHNFHRYLIYQNGIHEPRLAFATYAEALAAARKLSNVHIRDTEAPGWAYAQYDRYRLYQGHNSLPDWSFPTLEAARKEAARWSNSHIIALEDQSWVWDNISPAREQQLRTGAKVYELEQDGEPTGTAYGFLKEARAAALQVPGLTVRHKPSGTVVFANEKLFRVLQNGRELARFYSVTEAAEFAKGYSYAEIRNGDTVWWSSVPFWQVKQGAKSLGYVHKLSSALALAGSKPDAVVISSTGRIASSNVKRLLYWGWHGTSAPAVVDQQLGGVQGLDISSPTWYELAAADGTLKDSADPTLAARLQASGVQLMPLVHNQFDAVLTSAFLADPAAQRRFINTLVASLVRHGASGVNLDFEAMSGKDRERYTAFVSSLATEARKHKLKVSIDLPRGSMAWNHLTAFDHAALADIVDYVIIMAYDQHWRGSDAPGSVAGMQWTEEGITDFLSYGIPRSKLLLGIPFYVREWQLDAQGALVGNRAIFMADIPAYVAAQGATATFDARFGQTKYTYVKDGYTYVFWAETIETVKQRVALAHKYDLAGIAAWRLGYEAPELWTALLQLK